MNKPLFGDQLTFEQINNFQMPQVNSEWKRYNDTVNAMSPDQRNWVNKQESVIRSKEYMMSMFFDYLFEQYKDAFVSVSDGRYKSVVSAYIDEIQKSGDKYVSRAEQLESRTAQLEKENEELRIQMKQFLDRSHDVKQMATDGSRRSGKGNIDKTVRTGNNSTVSSDDFKLIQD